jgi:LasA protease
MKSKTLKIGLAISALVLVRCFQPAPQSDYWRADSSESTPTAANVLPGLSTRVVLNQPATRAPNQPIQSPTPNPPLILPTLRVGPAEYTVQAGDTLRKISTLLSLPMDTLIKANNITNPDLISLGQVLVIPVPSPQAAGTSFKIIPDSELIFGPMSATLDIFDFVKAQGGYLSLYRENINNEDYSGAEIVLRVASEYSVNPRLLLAVLEYQSGWVTEMNPDTATLDYPMLYYESWRIGLYAQLSWAANQLNRGYYFWKISAISHWLLSDGGLVPVNPTINPGTAGVQNLMAQLHDRVGWDQAVGDQGVFKVYERFFGYPFDYTIDPVVPDGLSQPVLQLPFEDGKVWSFTGGPHAGWGDGSAWAALDFAPPGGGLGCVVSNEWVTASADGLVVRSENGAVVLDLDGDGLEQTGWTLVYLHISSTDRIPAGSVVKAGDRIGYPSCEGGQSNGTHVHIARRYDGEWISADQSLPFNLDGWISQGAGVEYNGNLVRNGAVVEALDRVAPQNQISR